MAWFRMPLWKNSSVVQQDSLVVSDTLISSDSLVFDTIPALNKSDSVSIVPANPIPVNLSDTNKSPSLTDLENVDTKEVSSRDNPVPSQNIAHTEGLRATELTAKKPVFVYDSTLFQTARPLNRIRIPFPEDLFSLKALSKKSKQLDFFVYEKKHKGRSGKTTTTKLNYTGDILVQNRNPYSGSGWLLGIFLIVFILLARMKLLFSKFIPPIINSSFSYRAVQNLYRNRNSIYFQAGLNLDLIFLLSSGVFVLQLLRYFELKLGLLSDFMVFLIAIGALLVWLILKFLIGKLSGYISLNTALFSEYFHSILIYNKNVGLFLIPITLGIAYINPVFNKMFVFIGICIVSIAYVLKVIRFIQIFKSKRISSFYSILYLCALEILPGLLLVRVLVPLNKV